MINATLKGLLGRKLRTGLTALAIVLGVAMIAGAFVTTDTMIMMDDGQVIEEAPPEQLFEAPEHERTRRFFSAIEAG